MDQELVELIRTAQELTRQLQDVQREIATRVYGVAGQCVRTGEESNPRTPAVCGAGESARN